MIVPTLIQCPLTLMLVNIEYESYFSSPKFLVGRLLAVGIFDCQLRVKVRKTLISSNGQE